jgi:hypothetical protein
MAEGSRASRLASGSRVVTPSAMLQNLLTFVSRRRSLGVLLALSLLALSDTSSRSRAQSLFLDFNNPGQYTNSFNPWNNVGVTDGGNYAFQESSTNGVGGGGCVSVFQSSNTTAVCKAGSWDFSTNGAALTASGHVRGQLMRLS